MKSTPFFKIKNFRFNLLAPLLKRKSGDKKVSTSTEDLLIELTSMEYEEKINSLVKKDLLKFYSQDTIDKVLKHISFLVINGNYIDAWEDETRTVDLEEDLNILTQEIDIRESEINYILEDKKIDEIFRVKKRIPKWFRNTHQINTRILVAFMELLGDSKSVPFHKLESSCHSIKTFQNNYVQMKSFGEKNHAKVFEEAGSRITLWEPIREFIKKEYEKYLRRGK